MKSTIKLFSAVPIDSIGKKDASKELLEKTIKRGFIFSPEVIHNYSKLDELIAVVEEVVGISGEKANSSFHKSWGKIRDAKIEQLVIEQIIHYFTTYGFKRMGIYSEESVYIPAEKLEIPDLKDGIKLTVIKGYTKDEIKVKLLKLLESGIALKKDTVDDVVDVSVYLDLGAEEVGAIKNKEVRAVLYTYLDIIPENAVEFLRYVVYKTSDTLLLIKSPVLIKQMKERKNIGIIKLFNDYGKMHGFEKLAEIFYRFKPIFLALRTNPRMKPVVNKIRRLAVKHHKPMPEDYLNEVTAKIKNNKVIDAAELEKELDKVNIFRKIRLAYALKFRTNDVDAIMYRIRNGKGYATDFSFENKDKAKNILSLVLESIVQDVSKVVKGKKIFIPEHISYSLPATEKQFTGNFPSGTYVVIPKDMIFGVYWKNVGGEMIDLDLSLISPDTGKIGWDSSYRTDDRNILFSGDLTDAPRGATELFYIARQKKDALIFCLNYYNFDEDITVPFKIIVAKEKPSDFKENYTVNPNNIVSVVQSEISNRQKVLGLVITTVDECRFYFVETSIGGSITSSESEFAENARKYLVDFYQNTISLRDVLVMAEAELVDDKEKCDIDLSPEVLEKDSILNLLL